MTFDTFSITWIRIRRRRQRVGSEDRADNVRQHSYRDLQVESRY